MKKRISTPKKVALAVLGALTILTLVNLIEASVHKYKSDEHAFHVQSDHNEFFQDDHNVEFDVHADVDIDFDEHDIKVVIKDKNIVLEKRHEVALSFNNSPNGELMKEHAFDVREGDLMSVDVGDANIIVQTHNQDVAHVAIYLDSDNMNKAQAFFEEQNFEITNDEAAVYVRTSPERNNHSWDVTGGAEITVTLTIPAVFNVDIRTTDGDILLQQLEGNVSLHTSDGDIRTQSITGETVSIRTSDGDIQTAVLNADDLSIRTSDGDISLEDLSSNKMLIRTSDGDIVGNSIVGPAAISTSDGDINISSIKGDEINLRTSDGEILVDQLLSEVSKVLTSDGSIVLRDVQGDLTAKTSSGDLRVSLDNATNVFLRTREGNIYIDAPSSYSANVYLKGENVQLAEGFGFSGELEEHTASGTINGGGYSFEARTSDGEVVFREN